MKLHKLRLYGEGDVGLKWKIYLDDMELVGVTNVDISANIGDLCIATIKMYVFPEKIDIESVVPE